MLTNQIYDEYEPIVYDILMNGIKEKKLQRDTHKILKEIRKTIEDKFFTLNVKEYKKDKEVE